MIRLLNGVALAGVYPPAVKLVRTRFVRRRVLALGLVIGGLTFRRLPVAAPSRAMQTRAAPGRMGKHFECVSPYGAMRAATNEALRQRGESALDLGFSQEVQVGVKSTWKRG